MATAGAAAVLVGSFLPWLRSGSRGRSSYELYGLVGRLGFAESALARRGVSVWPLVPVLVVAVAVAAWWGRRWLSAGLGVGAGVYVATICVLGWRAPLPASAGVAVSFAGAIVLVGAAGAHAWARPA